MKNYISHILFCAVLLVSSCAKDNNISEGEGVVNFSISISSKDNQTRAYDPTESLLVRIYNADGGLIRRYTSAQSMPENLYLIAGEYKIVVEAGDKSTATLTNKSYRGEKTFTVKANQAITEKVVCSSINIGAQVSFDQTVTDKFDMGAKVYVSASNQFKLSEINDVPTLIFDSGEAVQTGYYLLPEGTTNLSWGFYGKSTAKDDISTTGVISNVEAAMVYKLKFQYSKTPDGLVDITVLVDKSPEEFFDNIIFSPQPVIKGDGFPINKTIGFNNQNVEFIVASVKKLAKVNMTVNQTIHAIYNTTTPPAPIAGISYETIDANNIRVILAPEFFASYPAGVHTLNFDMTDADAGDGKGTARVAMPGLLEVEADGYDLWKNSAVLKAVVTDPNATDVKIAYRTTDGTWIEAAATKDENLVYTANIAPNWSSSTNAGNHTVYQLITTTGIYANKDYEYKLVVDGVDMGDPKSLSTHVTMPIPYGDMEDGGLSCFTSDNASTAMWGSGNNDQTKSLCTQSTYTGMQGAKCAKTTATSVLGVLASGNLFTGTFRKDGLTAGVVGFGQSYNWPARPTALKLKYYAEKIGTVDISMHTGAPIGKGDQDKARIFVAIVDWNSRHAVKSGTSAPTGVWDPEQVSSTGEGKIIAYGSLFIEKSSEGGSMIDVELPLNFYDKNNLKPTGTYSLIISAATSAYGDYMVGCKSNVLYVDDFQWKF